MSSSKNSLDGLNIVRDYLRNNLDDPYVLAGGRERASWIFTDDPFSTATYPRIKLENLTHVANPIDIGSNYMDWEEVVVKIMFFSKRDFKVTIDGTVYKDEQLVYEYLNRIRDVLKSGFNDLYSEGIKGFRVLQFNTPAYDPEFQLQVGSMHCRFWLFRR